MREAYLPFLKYIILQLFVGVVGLNVIREKELGFSDVLKSWGFGQLLCFAVLQIMAVPMILARWKFNMLFWGYVIVCVALFSFGCRRLFKGEARIKIRIPKLSPFEIVLLVIVVLLILWQSGNYFFGMHLDEDDARWLAEANDALTTGDMMTRSFHTGEHVEAFALAQDGSSPWPMMYAVCARILSTKTSIFSHTIYAPLELLLMYGIYWQIGGMFFRKTEARLSFLLFVSLANMFYGGSVYTQSVFSLVRIWQGKASVAAIIIPILFYLFLSINKEDKIDDWVNVMVAATGACLMSGMGIFIAEMMIAVYGFYSILSGHRWKRIPLWMCDLVPCATFILTHIYLQG